MTDIRTPDHALIQLCCGCETVVFMEVVHSSESYEHTFVDHESGMPPDPGHTFCRPCTRKSLRPKPKCADR